MRKRRLKGMLLFILIFVIISNNYSYANSNIFSNNNVKVFQNNNVRIFNDRYLKRIDESKVLFSNKISDEFKEISFNASYETISTLIANTNLFDGLEIYISPYVMSDSNGYAYVDSKQISIAIDNMIGPELAKYMYAQSVILHELGHVLQGELMNKHGIALMNEYASYYDEFKYKNYYDNQSCNWHDDIDEAFAEDFKIYAGKRFFNRVSENKKTNQIYNRDIEVFFDKYI